MKSSIIFAVSLALLPASALAQQSISLAPFDRINATDGADVVVRHGGEQRITFLRGNPQVSRVEVEDGKLVVETCRHTCPWHYNLKLAVTMPALRALSANDGAVIHAQGNFPQQDRLAVKADDGGNIDVTAISVRHGEAKAVDGGNIHIRATASLNARATDGGNIVYRGTPALTMHSDDGGAISSERD